MVLLSLSEELCNGSGDDGERRGSCRATDQQEFIIITGCLIASDEGQFIAVIKVAIGYCESAGEYHFI